MAIDWSLIKDTLLLLSNIIVAVGVLLVWFQIKKDHERSRREHAAEIIREWIVNLDKDSPLAVKLVDNLNISQCTDIYNHNEVKIEKRWKNITEGCLSSLENIAEVKESGDYITLTESQSSHIRYLALNACNLLEFIFLSWKHSVADGEMIRDEFEGLLARGNGTFALETFRSASGGKTKFPATEEFIEYLRKSNKVKGVQRGRIA